MGHGVGSPDAKAHPKMVAALIGVAPVVSFSEQQHRAYAFDLDGDLTAAVLALVALAALRSGFGVPLVWVFNLWGSADLLNAFYQANASGLEAGMLQATYFIPTSIVPLLLITHVLVFLILIRRDSVAAAQ
jgi:hypothetical protein